jgi:hypothetical protein
MLSAEATPAEMSSADTAAAVTVVARRQTGRIRDIEDPPSFVSNPPFDPVGDVMEPDPVPTMVYAGHPATPPP